MQRYNFNKTRPFRSGVSAEGVAVHADSASDARKAAETLLKKGETLLTFRDNVRCIGRCWHCDK